MAKKRFNVMTIHDCNALVLVMIEINFNFLNEKFKV